LASSYDSYIQNPSTDNVYRERDAARDWTRGALTNLGFSKYAARDTAKKIFGDPADADASFSESLALVDFIPGVNLAFFGPESYRQFKQGKIVEPSLNLGGSIIEGGVLLKFLGSIGKKASSVVKGNPTIAGYLRQFNPE
tara:strand:+ start:179 stop:598 length:420 start_codon:yes stop_codon:yes gene_type:complete